MTITQTTTGFLLRKSVGCLLKTSGAQMRNLPKASDLNEETEEKQPKQQPKERPAKSVMKAIGKSVLNPKKKTKSKPKSKKPVEGSPEEEAMESKDFESQE